LILVLSRVTLALLTFVLCFYYRLHSRVCPRLGNDRSPLRSSYLIFRDRRLQIGRQAVKSAALSLPVFPRKNPGNTARHIKISGENKKLNSPHRQLAEPWPQTQVPSNRPGSLCVLTAMRRMAPLLEGGTGLTAGFGGRGTCRGINGLVGRLRGRPADGRHE
jgi:hypothetical protein